MVRSRPVHASEKIKEPHRGLKNQRNAHRSLQHILVTGEAPKQGAWNPASAIDPRMRVGSWDDAACWLSVSSAIASGIEIYVPEA